MKLLRLLLCAVVMSGCATQLKSTLPPPGAPVSFVGVTGPAIPAGDLEKTLARVQHELEARLASPDAAMPAQLARTADNALRVRLGADESFEPAAAELAPAALLVYAQLAEVLKQAPAFVAHVVVHGDTPAEELASDLTARRAASVQGYLVARGVPATRVRAEGRANAEALTREVGAGAMNRRVEVVLKPVVEGQEAAAWVSP